jgi:ferric-dicitrate binding protein FerR (iron transport regulator)
MDELLVKHLTGEATRQENLLIQQWLASDVANQQYFDHFRLIWEQSSELAAATTVDEHQAWERFKNKVQQGSFQNRPSKVWSLNNPLMRAAIVAGLVMGIACLTYFLFNNNPGKVLSMAAVSATNTIKTDTLPDNSVVILNKHSQVSYPEQFAKDKRVLQLNGEAFFKVQPNKEKPFEIHTNNVTITVVGTSFNVRSRGDTTEVVVETGIVRVAIASEMIELKAGEKAIVGVHESKVQKEANTDQLYNYYRSKKFVCDATPLWKLVEKLNEAYDVQIVFGNPGLRNQPLSTTFDNQPLENILKILSSTFDISVTTEKGKIILQ